MLPTRMRRIGWIVFRLLWIPFILIFVGMFRMPPGSYDWVDLPSITRIGIIGTAVLGALAMILLAGSVVLSSLNNLDLQTDGMKAQATVLEVRDTGTTINQNPLVHLKLKVEPGNQPSFEAETEQVIGRLQVPQVQPGAKVAVRYNPYSHAVALDTT
ncbi:MAG: hypothetical protein WBZ24_09540 [Anaerolineales bacterium]